MNETNLNRPADIFRGCLRQVHLDFHNSPFIPDIGADFDARTLAKQFKAAHVNSAVVFAKCVHGMCYYPSAFCKRHPAISDRDLTGELIEALHAEGIRAPIYTIIAWEEHLAQTHPEWMQMTREGTFAQLAGASDGKPGQPGRYRYLNFLHPDFQDYFEAHLREILGRYPVDGIFMDMLVIHPQACWSDASIAFREKHGLMADDAATHVHFETAAQLAFVHRFTPLIHGSHPNASVFYNADNPVFTDHRLGVAARRKWQSHSEIESLPTGMWGYHHFPRVARSIWLAGQPWVGMTGRFQRSWGDFGGIKPVAALEFECFRTQAMGGANSIGDQLHPRGRLDQGAYRLIGEVFRQCEIAEPFYASAIPIPQVGIIAPLSPNADPAQAAESEEGAVMLCQETHYDCAILNDESDLSPFKMIILPDGVEATPLLKQKLESYHAAGGSVMVSHLSAFDRSRKPSFDFLNLQWQGEATRWPNYWRKTSAVKGELDADDRVVYLRGCNVLAPESAKVLVERALPYFQRTDLHFTSHFQAPALQDACPHPAVVSGARWIYFADPIFRETRRYGNLYVKQVWQTLMQSMIGEPIAGDGLKSTIRVYPLRRGRDLILTLLHYIPKRRSLEIDVIEERMNFAGQILKLPSSVQTVTVFPTGEILHRGENGFALPAVEGRLLLQVKNFF